MFVIFGEGKVLELSCFCGGLEGGSRGGVLGGFCFFWEERREKTGDKGFCLWVVFVCLWFFLREGEVVCVFFFVFVFVW